MWQGIWYPLLSLTTVVRWLWSDHIHISHLVPFFLYRLSCHIFRTQHLNSMFPSTACTPNLRLSVDIHSLTWRNCQWSGDWGYFQATQSHLTTLTVMVVRLHALQIRRSLTLGTSSEGKPLLPTGWTALTRHKAPSGAVWKHFLILCLISTSSNLLFFSLEQS